jgi:tetratricopeptide (TPR) repeat protein
LEAIGVEADCVEAIYNLGLTNKRLSNLEDALQAFKKLHRIIPKDPQVIFQIANLYERLHSGMMMLINYGISLFVCVTTTDLIYWVISRRQLNGLRFYMDVY